MGTYISLLRFEFEGPEKLKEAPKLLDSCIEQRRSIGIDVRAAFLTMGAYDALIILEAPDDAAVARLTSLAIGSKPKVTTETLRGFSEEQYRKFLLSP